MQLARRYDGTVEFLGVAGRDDLGPMKEFVDRYTVPFPSVADLDTEIWRRAGVRGQPAFVFIEPDGSARLFFRPSEATVEAQLDRLAGA